jgi:molybdate transport system substrate-binding protein
LGNRLVLVTGKDSAIGQVAIGPGLDLAGPLGDGRLAVAEVEAVPAGRYAKAALEKLGVWPAVAGRLAQGENVRAALALVSRGEAPLGIVYRTDAAADPEVRVVGTFPADSHPPIVYPVALTADAPETAAAFLAFLRSAPAARAAFARAGFVVLGPPAS